MRAGRICATVAVAMVAATFSIAGPAQAATAGSVSSSTSLNARTGPATWYARVRVLSPGAGVAIACQATGQPVSGGVRSTNRWDRLVDGTYISDAWVYRPEGIPGCGSGPPPPPPPPVVLHTGTVVAPGSGLNVRSGPARSYQRVGLLPDGAPITLTCQVEGQQVAGSVRDSNVWDRLVDGTYVSDAWIRRTSGEAAPTCTGPATPPAISLPAGTPPAVVTAVNWALAQLDTPYHFGGDCTAAHSGIAAHQCDCSSLVQMAYRSAGIYLPRIAAAQSRTGAPVGDPSQLRPGDLMFIPGANGSVANPGHVGIYLRDGLVLHAPQTGLTVRIAPVTQHWLNGLVIRRIVL
jgi:uncharacterized protein YraI